MIEHLHIENFKSIKALDIDCKKINIFIGEPNTGKSNIIEALSFFSPNAFDFDSFNELIRFKSITDLFFDNDTTNPIIVKLDNIDFQLATERNADGTPTFNFIGSFNKRQEAEGVLLNADYSFSNNINPSFIKGNRFDMGVKVYSFKRHLSFSPKYNPFLNPPFGDNLAYLIITNPELKNTVSSFFRSKGLRLQLKPAENDISVAKEVKDEIYSYPYHTISETLQRIVFMMMAIDSNKNSTLVFDEPESNTFPFYTKYMAERIALDESNQYFLTTHNPYLLMSMIEKCKLSDLNLFVARMENYETKLTLLNDNQVQEAFDMGPDFFFNLERIIEE